MRILKCIAMIVVLAFGTMVLVPGFTHAAAPTTNLREVFESMGASVKWVEATKSIEVERGNVQLSFKTDSNIAIKNGSSVTMDTPIFVNQSGKAQISVYAIYPLAKDHKREKHYIVQPGDSLWKISLKYAVSVHQLQEWNNLPTDMIYVGQHLVTQDPYYIVKPGDTLYRIASQTQSSISEIQRVNQLESTSLQIGQKLYIPPAPSVQQPPMFTQGVFPLMDGTYEAFTDTYGDQRTFTLGLTSRVHEGIDIMAKTWVPLFAADDGVVIRKGWNTLGGWRLTVQSSNKVAHYYAHMAGYADGIANGSTIKKGQLIGFVGATGYGDVGTTGKFVPHLHFSLYDTTVSPWKPLNPYTYLRWWESR